jgi:hypothetical protein
LQVLQQVCSALYDPITRSVHEKETLPSPKVHKVACMALITLCRNILVPF